MTISLDHVNVESTTRRGTVYTLHMCVGCTHADICDAYPAIISLFGCWSPSSSPPTTKLTSVFMTRSNACFIDF